MKVNSKRAKSSGISVGVAIGAAFAAHFATKTIAEKMPENKAAKYAPHAILAATIVLPALDLVPNSDVVNSALIGASVISGISVANTLVAPEEGEDPANLGIKGTIRKYVPQLSGVAGYHSLGNVYEYSEAIPASLLEAGSHYQSANAMLGNAPSLESAASLLM